MSRAIIGRAALDDRRRRLRLTGDVDHQQHRRAERRGDIGGGACAPGLSRHAVEEPHRGFAQQQGAAGRRAGGEILDERGRHRPTIEIEARPPRGCRVKRRIDIIGTRFDADDIEPLSTKGAQQAERHGRLAAARARRRDDQSVRRHDVDPDPSPPRKRLT